MDKLIELGLSSNDIENMILLNPMIKFLNFEEIESNISILENIQCENRHIKNILITNSFYLTRSIDDIEKLINKLLSLGFTNLNLLFDANPFFLNLDSFEIDEFIKEKQKDDMLLVDIIDLIDSNPYIFDMI